MFRWPQNPKSRRGPNPAFPLCFWKQHRERLKNAVPELVVRILSGLHRLQGLFLSPPFPGEGRTDPGSLRWATEQSWAHCLGPGSKNRATRQSEEEKLYTDPSRRRLQSFNFPGREAVKSGWVCTVSGLAQGKSLSLSGASQRTFLLVRSRKFVCPTASNGYAQNNEQRIGRACV